jgi:hypothetical protein
MSISRSERLMNKIGDKVGISECGLEWLKAALDPYHDEPIACTGMPVGDEASTVVQVIRQSSNVSVNSGNSGNYDCHVIAWPWETNFDLGPSAASLGLLPLVETPSGIFTTTGGQIHSETGGVTAVSVNAGTTPTIATPPQVQICAPARYFGGVYRVVAKGFEVYNTTAELTVQGSITNWRQPTPVYYSAEASVLMYDTVTTGGSVYTGFPTFLQIQSPPYTTANALLLEGTKEWLAKDGAYHVCTLNSINPPATSGSYVMPYVTAGGNTGWTIFPSENGATLNLAPLKLPWATFNMQGCILTGLSNTTTLRIDAIWYIERFPDITQLDLVVLAQRAPEYDTQALQTYSHAIRKMPVAVPVAENGLGDWFKDVVSTVSDYVSPVLSMIPHPAAQGLSMAIKGVDRVANSSKYQPPSSSANVMASVKSSLAKAEVKAKNAQVKAKNAITRAKNEEIRARKAAKAAKGK